MCLAPYVIVMTDIARHDPVLFTTPSYGEKEVVMIPENNLMLMDCLSTEHDFMSKRLSAEEESRLSQLEEKGYDAMSEEERTEFVGLRMLQFANSGSVFTFFSKTR